MWLRAEPTPPPPPPPPRPAPSDRRGRWLLLLLALSVGLACSLPWASVSFAALMPEVLGPAGWRTPAGFTCILCHLLVAMLTLLDHGPARAAVRDGSLLLVSAAALVLGYRWLLGPGELRGLLAAWTAAFYGTALLVLSGLWLTAERVRSHRA